MYNTLDTLDTRNTSDARGTRDLAVDLDPAATAGRSHALPVEDALLAQVQSAKRAAARLAAASAERRDEALLRAAARLRARAGSVYDANGRDVESARRAGLNDAFLDRLLLTPARLDAAIAGIEAVARSEFHVGDVMVEWKRPNGLLVQKVRVPLGVVLLVFEARPNVAVDVAALCLKTANASLLKAGVEAEETCRILVDAIREGMDQAGLSTDAVQLITGGRAAVGRLIRMRGLVDAVIPRGGAGLISSVVENASVPVIETGTGNCHVYVDRAADLDKAVRIIVNAKTSRPAVCNAAETLLVHREVAPRFLPLAAAALAEHGVELRADSETRALLPGIAVTAATEEDWATEYLALILAIKVVGSVEEAVEHVGRYGTGHSEAIVTEDDEAAEVFLARVDAACVYHNASTRFTDGGEFGFGAEVGISTQKLHARGPMGLDALTTYKYVVRGSGQVRS